MTSQISARFDQAAAGWDANPTRVALAKAVAEAIRSAVPLRPDMQAMDIGAGTGLLTLALLPHVGSMTALDASGQMIQVLAGKLASLGLDNVRTIRADAASDPLPSAAFDLVVSSMAFHHLRDIPATLRRLRSCLRPGGWLATADLDAEDGSFHSDATGVFHHGLHRHTVMEWLTAAGFTDATCRDAYRIVRSGQGGETREYGVFLATARAG